MSGSHAWNHRIEDANGPLKGQGVIATPFESIAYDVGDVDTIGVRFAGATVVGTVAVAIQESFDGGSTWTDTFPDAENSETQAAISDLSAGNVSKWWPSWHNSLPDPATVDENAQPVDFGARALIRFSFTGGTSIDFDSGDARIHAKKFTVQR